MTEVKHMLMSAGGNTFCEVSITHHKRHAVAWVEINTDNKYLTCGPCADEAEEVGYTLLRDLRENCAIINCAWCGRQYLGSDYHNCRGHAGEPFVVIDDEGRKLPL